MKSHLYPVGLSLVLGLAAVAQANEPAAPLTFTCTQTVAEAGATPATLTVVHNTGSQASVSLVQGGGLTPLSATYTVGSTFFTRTYEYAVAALNITFPSQGKLKVTASKFVGRGGCGRGGCGDAEFSSISAVLNFAGAETFYFCQSNGSIF